MMLHGLDKALLVFTGCCHVHGPSNGCNFGQPCPRAVPTGRVDGSMCNSVNHGLHGSSTPVLTSTDFRSNDADSRKVCRFGFR